MLNFIPTKDSICQEPILHLLMKVLSGQHAGTTLSECPPAPEVVILHGSSHPSPAHTMGNVFQGLTPQVLSSP